MNSAERHRHDDPGPRPETPDGLAGETMNVDELLGGEGGVWTIRTRDSHYEMRLDEGTVQRFPGPLSNPGLNDALRRIRDIRTCKVGEHGYWTMWPDDGDPTVDYLWQYTSEIKSIERTDTDDANR